MNILPTARKNAAENMADDELLLNAYPQPDFPRFRHYKWTRTAYTFGYMQAFQRVLDCLPLPPQELIRRPTGGGVVDHRNDWTYALVIPQTHQIAKYAPLQIYLDLHTLLKKSLERCSQLKLHIFQPKRHSQEKNAFPLPLSSSASQCFQTPSPYDLLLPNG